MASGEACLSASKLPELMLCMALFSLVPSVPDKHTRGQRVLWAFCSSSVLRAVSRPPTEAKGSPHGHGVRLACAKALPVKAVVGGALMPTCSAAALAAPSLRTLLARVQHSPKRGEGIAIAAWPNSLGAATHCICAA